jgi:hypothetical protein
MASLPIESITGWGDRMAGDEFPGNSFLLLPFSAMLKPAS